MKSLQSKLKAAGIKPSLQRMKILEYLLSHRTHPTVEMIYADLKEAIPTISKTTIYNTLSAFAKGGLVLDLSISGYQSRYDGMVSPHAHFLCKDCGKVIDIEEQLPVERKAVAGNKIDELHVYYKGVCRGCLKGGPRVKMRGRKIRRKRK